MEDSKVMLYGDRRNVRRGMIVEPQYHTLKIADLFIDGPLELNSVFARFECYLIEREIW